MKWLAANWLPLLIVILLILAFIVMVIYLCKKKGLRKVALEAILEAENFYNSTTGQERLDMAILYVYSRLPIYLTVIIPEPVMKKVLKNFIQKVFNDIKDALDYQKPQLEEGGK